MPAKIIPSKASRNLLLCRLEEVAPEVLLELERVPVGDDQALVDWARQFNLEAAWVLEPARRTLSWWEGLGHVDRGHRHAYGWKGLSTSGFAFIRAAAGGALVGARSHRDAWTAEEIRGARRAGLSLDESLVDLEVEEVDAFIRFQVLGWGPRRLVADVPLRRTGRLPAVANVSPPPGLVDAVGAREVQRRARDNRRKEIGKLMHRLCKGFGLACRPPSKGGRPAAFTPRSGALPP